MDTDNMKTDKLVIFKKPKIKELLNQGFSCVDMHLHTKHSKDSSINTKKLLKKASKLGIGIAITDHNQISGYIEATQLAEEMENPPLLIPGIEVCCSNNAELLFYFYKKEDLVQFYENEIKMHKNERKYVIKTDIIFKRLIENAKKYNALIVAPHPYYKIKSRGVAIQVKKGYMNQTVYNKLDALEVVNICLSKKKNILATELAAEKNLAITGGSDAHALFLVGKGIIAFKGKTIRDALDAIKKKNNLVIGRSIRPFSKLRPGVSITKLGFLHPLKKIRETGIYSRIKNNRFFYRINTKKHMKKNRKLKH